MTNIRTDIEELFIEQFEDYLNDDNTYRATDPETEDLVELPPYWSDRLFEIAEAAVPVYHHEQVKMWTELNYPETEFARPEASILEQIAAALYEQCNETAHLVADDFGFNE